jgi:apolipoprotein D and lipocalin family protein
MPRRLAVLVLATFAVASLPTIACTGDPPLDVATDVDLGRFQGKWYEIARLPRTTQTDCYGTTAFYTGLSDGSLQLVHQCNVGSSTGPLNTVTMLASAPNASVKAKLALSVAGFSGDYWILEVGQNYEYAVVGHPSRAYLWILSREPTLDTATLEGVIERAQKNQFPISELLFTPQPPAQERITSQTPIGPIPPAMTTGCSAASAASRYRPADGMECTAGLFLAAMVGLRRGRLRRETRAPSA